MKLKIPYTILCISVRSTCARHKRYEVYYGRSVKENVETAVHVLIRREYQTAINRSGEYIGTT